MYQEGFLSTFLWPSPPQLFHPMGRSFAKPAFIVYLVCIFIWLGMTYLQRLCFLSSPIFQSLFLPLSPVTSNPLWFFLALKGLMVQNRTWIFGNVFQPPLTAASEKFREQQLRRAKGVPVAKCSREVFVFKNQVNILKDCFQTCSTHSDSLGRIQDSLGIRRWNWV